jgi:phage anti-repressor protein
LTAKDSLLTEGDDYLTKSGEWSQQGRSSDSIVIRKIDAFKQFCLIAQTEKGLVICHYLEQAQKQFSGLQPSPPPSSVEQGNSVAIVPAQTIPQKQFPIAEPQIEDYTDPSSDEDYQRLFNFWLDRDRQGTRFPVDFEIAWKIAGYSRRDNARRRLTDENSLLVEDEDYIIVKGSFLNPEESGLSGRSSDSIYLTIDAFKQFCLMAETEKGREIRQYFIEAEKQLRLYLSDQFDHKDRLLAQKQSAIAELNQALEEQQSLHIERYQALQFAIAERDRALEEQQSLIAERDRALEENQSLIVQRDRALLMHNFEMNKKREVLAEKESAVAQRDQLLLQKRADIAELERDLALVRAELDALKADQELQSYRDRDQSHYSFCQRYGFLHDDGRPDDFKAGLLFERINQAASQFALEINREYPSNRKAKRRRKARPLNKSKSKS